MARSKGAPEENLMAAIFGEKRWDPRFPLCYPYIVIKEDEEERQLGLTEAIQNAMSTLPLTDRRGRNDPEGLNRHKQVLELRLGLRDGISRTLKRVGQELEGITKERVRQIEAKALRMMRHPARSRRLREFFVPSPEDRAERDKKLQELKEELRRSGARIERLVGILGGVGLSEKDFEKATPEDIPQIAQALKEEQEDQAALQAMIAKFPNNAVWNAIARAYRINPRLSTLKKLVESGEIRKVRQIGEKAEEFLRQVLQVSKQGTPS